MLGIENGYVSLFNLSPEGVLIIDRKGFITEANPAAATMFGCDFTNKEFHINNFIGPYKSYKNDLCADVLHSDTSIKLEKTVLKRNKEKIEVEIWVKKCGDNGYIAFVKNITMLKNGEQKLDNIVRIQSHDVRAPLANIVGLVNLMDLDNQSREINMSLLTHLKSSAKKLDSVIRNIVHQARSVEPIRKTKLVLFFQVYIPIRKFIVFLFCKIKGMIKFLLRFFNLAVEVKKNSTVQKEPGTIESSAHACYGADGFGTKFRLKE